MRKRAAAGRHETLVVRIALAVAALSALDRAFVHREPGTSARDHLASGLVPAALALALALAYPRLRPGVRASLALSVGVVVLVGAIAGPVRHALTVGPDAGDVTGIAAAAAGALLIVAAAVCAWRSRRLDERPARRYARRLLVGVAAVLVLYEVVYPVALAGVATQRVRWRVPEADLGAPALPVRLRAGDGIALEGWYVPSRNGAAIIVSPGRSEEVQAHVRMLTRHGYGVLVFDRRGEGASEGDANALGWSGERDLRAAIAYLGARPDVRDGRIGGLGLSVGGEMLLETAAHDRALRAVVSEGAGRRSLLEQRHMHGVARWQLAPQMAVLTAATAVAADDAPPPDLAALVSRIAPRPVLLVHARHGLVDEVLNREYYARAGEPKAIWEVARGGHTGALAAEPREYERRIVGFFDRALPAAG